MLQKMLCVLPKVLKTFVPALAIALTLFLGGEVFADAVTPKDVTVDNLVNFDGIFSTLTTMIGTVVAGAIGLAVSVWVVRYVWGIIKSTAR